MRSITRNNRPKRPGTVNRLSGVETLSPRLVFSGMVLFGPMQTTPLPEPKQVPSEVDVTRHAAKDLRELDVNSLPAGVRPAEECPYDPTVHIREVNQREPEELVPTAEAGNDITQDDIPEEMRNTDELFGDRDFWILGSRPLDYVSQEFSGPGTVQYPDLGPPLAFDPSSLVAPGPLGGVPDSNLGNILNQIPSLADVANDEGGFWEWFKGLFSDEDDETPPSEDNTPPSEDETAPGKDWVDVDAPPLSHPVVKAQADFWNEGMSETSGGLSSLTTHLEKRGK